MLVDFGIRLLGRVLGSSRLFGAKWDGRFRESLGMRGSVHAAEVILAWIEDLYVSIFQLDDELG